MTPANRSSHVHDPTPALAMNVPENMTLKDTLDESGKNGLGADASIVISDWFGWFARISILVAIVVSPWLFGGVQYQAKFWIAAATLAGLGFWWFETAVNQKSSQVFPYIGVLLGLGILIGLLQLLPLPEFMLGRQTELYARYATDASNVNNPEVLKAIPVRMTMSPEGTWYTIQLLFIAFAGLLLGCRFFRTQNHLTLLLSVCTFNGAAIAFFGLIQKMTFDPKHPKLFWSIDLTNGGVPFGPYVNRNNCAGYLLMCLAAAIGLLIVVSNRNAGGLSAPKLIVSKEIPFWRQFNFYLLRFISELTAAKIATLIAMTLIATGIVSTLSRGGVLALLVGAIITLATYARARRASYAGLVFLPLVVLVIAFSAWVGFGEQFLERVQEKSEAQSNSRLAHWQEMIPATSENGWLGYGLGSYKNVHRIYRETRELGAFQFAENNFLQALVEAGWPGLILYLLAFCLALCYSLLLMTRGTSAGTVAPGVTGMFLLSSQAVASFFDFGFYLPANLILMSVLVGFLAYHAHSLAGRLKKQTWLKYQLPNHLVQIALLIVFAGVTFSTLDFYRRWEIDSVMDVKVRNFSPTTLTLKETEDKIGAITPLLNRTSSAQALGYTARLWIHRSRLKAAEQLDSLKAIDSMPESERVAWRAKNWDLTQLARIDEHVASIRRDESEYAAIEFTRSPFAVENYPRARLFLELSRRQSPMQASVHAQVARLNSIAGNRRSSEIDMVRAIELAPGSDYFNREAAIFFINAGQLDVAAPYLKRMMELDPRKFALVMEIVSGRSGRLLRSMSEDVLFASVIPDSPQLMFQFATRHVKKDSPVRLEALERAEELLGAPLPSDPEQMLLSANIKLAKGDLDGGIEQLELAINSSPGDYETRLRLARLLLENGQLDESREHAERLLDFNSRKKTYIEFAAEVDEAIMKRNEVKDQEAGNS